jgi:hypothetical protein
VTFADVPSDLTGQALTEWLEERGLALVDYFAWLRTQDPEAGKRPPPRRRLLTQEQVAALDDEIEREERPLW